MKPRRAPGTIVAVFVMFAACGVLLFGLTPATAQTLADQVLTPGTACGARGVGRLDAGPFRGAIVEREAPGQRVDEGGNWVICAMPIEPAAIDCGARVILVWRGKSGRWCQAQRRSTPSGTLGDTFLARGARNGTPLDQAQPPLVGYRKFECTLTENGPAWVTVASYCR